MLIDIGRGTENAPQSTEQKTGTHNASLFGWEEKVRKLNHKQNGRIVAQCFTI